LDFCSRFIDVCAQQVPLSRFDVRQAYLRVRITWQRLINGRAIAGLVPRDDISRLAEIAQPSARSGDEALDQRPMATSTGPFLPVRQSPERQRKHPGRSRAQPYTTWGAGLPQRPNAKSAPKTCH
jgi:hypothetical protein